MANFKVCCLSEEYVLLAGLLMWPLWERICIASQRLDVQHEGKPFESIYSEEKLEVLGRVMRAGDWEGSSEQDIKMNNKK